MKIRDIISAIEAFAPPSLQESYDNTGYQVGNPDAKATGALLCVDVTEEIIDEAADKGYNLIISPPTAVPRAEKRNRVKPSGTGSYTRHT